MLVKSVVKPVVQTPAVNPVATTGLTGVVSAEDPLLPGVDRSLVLDFVSMDTSYSTGATLNLDFINSTYQSWSLPNEPQGAYLRWIGTPTW
jgi:hypothetical protein